MQWNRALSALRQRWWLVVSWVLVGALAGAGAAALVPVRYQSTATVFITLDRGATATEFSAGSTFAQSLMPSYAQVATMPVVLEPVVVALDLDMTPAELASKVTATVPAGTSLLDVTVSDSTPTGAARIANAIAATLPNAIGGLSPRTSGGGSALRVATASTAVPPTAPSSMSAVTLTVAGAVAALVLGLGLVVVLEASRRPVRRRADVSALTDAPVIGVIPRSRVLHSRSGPVVATDSREVEPLKMAGVAVSLLDDGRPPQRLVLGSAMPGAGSSTLAANIALALAMAPRRVLLVDADGREGGMSDTLGLLESPGLVGVLRDGVPASAVWQQWLDPRSETELWVLPAGTTNGVAAADIESERMSKLLERARAEFDVVVVDGPPVLTSATSIALARQVGVVLLTIDAQRNGQAQVAEALDRLDIAGAEVVGVVLNRTPRSLRSRMGSWRVRRADARTAERRAQRPAVTDGGTDTARQADETARIRPAHLPLTSSLPTRSGSADRPSDAVSGSPRR